MIFKLLGALSVGHRGSLTPTATKQRQVLALLLVNANATVHQAHLMEELWEGSPPAHAIAALQTYVMHLRKALRPLAGGETRLRTRRGGYELVVNGGELDVDLFEALVRSADTADPGTAAELLREALRLWTGPALVDVTAGPVLRDAACLLARRHLDVVGDRVDLDLALGRHHDLLGELSALVHGHRTTERFTAQLMVALHRCGRRVDALSAFHRLRQAITDDGGGPLSRPLHELYSDILSADPKLDPPPTLRPTLTLDVVPRQRTSPKEWAAI
ncbi:AfsR/SARP family transcriptional regulator [Actinokineospora terrae]|uniref:DNA-binding transcriptional activator of the SARP family n=1 Tax=Actinokineospora terrae TaxID=155974 RepID=A0A1H9WJY2_9PSEU|nr:AfsR/SARP family transcriptional regulator [Actinokineospora terrae]SES33753.1 DNA-binding transcriptional activator of the SARP family [Actinokineospora terrae]